jgi:hypothetical protein
MAKNIRDISDNEMRVKDIIDTHYLYDRNLSNWNFLMASYEGTRQLVKLGYLERHERESLKNYQRRLSEAYGFGYSRSIIDLFNFYLFKKPVKREMAKLKDDDLWNSFVNDCDLDGTSLDDFLTEQNKYAAIYGAIGILVDRTQEIFENKAEQKDAGVYPYLSAYFPSAILDWDFDRDQYNRPYLSYLKLVDDDKRYFLWWQDKFKIFTLPESEDSGNAAWLNSHVVKVREAKNPIGVIPFIWLYNMKGRKKPIGVSDIEEVARIDKSIMRNLSDGEEIITYASFPMMRKPMREMRPDGVNAAQGPDDIGATAILEFDPEHPESKPDWLQSEVAAPVDAIAKWIANKIAEIYRATNAGGMAGMEVSTAPKSGAALQAEFQLLNASLVRKAKNLENAEKKIIYYWLLWEQAKEFYEDVIVERSRTYDVENLAADLENTMTATMIVTSKKFAAAVQKQIVRQMLPAFNDRQISEIDDEIDAESLVSHTYEVGKEE